MLSRQKLVRAGAAVAALGATLTLGFAGGSPANADPKQFNAFAGVGSDTIQDVMNALSGHSNGVNYEPAQSSAATGQRQLISFDATGSDCIATKLGGPSFDRPNGSSAGRRALSRAIDGTGFGNTGSCGATPDISGQVDFARSSSTPNSGDTGTALTYVPLGRDGMGFAYYKPSGGTVVDTLTRAQLTSLFTGSGAQTINGVRVLPCGIQVGSGTFEFWNKVTTASAAQEETATAECNAYVGRSQENDGVDLKAMGDAADAANPGTQVIIGFSAGAYIAKTNGVAEPAPPSGVEMGLISNDGNNNNLGSPVQAHPSNPGQLIPVASYFDNSVFGRMVFNVFDTTVIDSAFGNNDLKSLFKDTNPDPAINTATICAMTDTIQTFGFLPTPSCGNTSLKGSFYSGQHP